MHRTERPARWAVVSSPGDRWFSLDVDGGFSLDHFEEDTPGEDVHQILSRYLELALRYLRDQPMPYPQGMLRLRVIKISTDDGDFVLRRSIVGELKSLFKRSRLSGNT
jgi:hypothetical protein